MAVAIPVIKEDYLVSFYNSPFYLQALNDRSTNDLPQRAYETTRNPRLYFLHVPRNARGMRRSFKKTLPHHHKLHDNWAVAWVKFDLCRGVTEEEALKMFSLVVDLKL
jgi:hypothetical protein